MARFRREDKHWNVFFFQFNFFKVNNFSFYVHTYNGSKPVATIVLNWCRNLKLLNLCRNSKLLNFWMSSHFIARLKLLSRVHILWEYDFKIGYIHPSSSEVSSVQVLFFHWNTMHLNTTKHIEAIEYLEIWNRQFILINFGSISMWLIDWIQLDIRQTQCQVHRPVDLTDLAHHFS